MARMEDDVYKRKKYKNVVYNGKKSTIDDYTKERVFYGNRTGAKHLHPATKTSDTDHITPIDAVNKRYSDLSVQQRRKIANNREHNYATTSSHINRTKRGLENHQYIIKRWKDGDPLTFETSARMLAKEAESRIYMGAEATSMRVQNTVENSKLIKSIKSIDGVEIVQNTGEGFLTGAVDTVKGSAMLIISDSLEKLIVEGESVENTLKGAGGTVINVAVVGGTEKILIDTASSIFKNSGSQVLNNIAEMNVIGQCLVLGASVGASAIKYLNGEIDADQFADEIMMNGKIIGISTIINMAVPIPLIGPMISSIAVKAVTTIYETKRHMNDYLLKEDAVKHLASEAVAEMECKRSEFHRMVQDNLDEWDETVENAFGQIISCSLEDSFNLDGIVGGLDKILSLCGEKAAFHSVDEWENQLDTTLNLNF